MKETIEEFKKRFCDKCDNKDCKRKFYRIAKCSAIILAMDKSDSW